MQTLWCERSPGFGTTVLAAAMVVKFLRHLMMPPAHRARRSAIEISSVVQNPPPGEAG